MTGPAPTRRRLRRWLAAAACIALLLVLSPGTAAAHANLELVDPPDGATLDTMPGQVRMAFSEAVRPDLVWVELVDTKGQVVDGATVAADPADDHAVLVGLPAEGAGSYRLAWQVIDEEDLHVTSGTVVFGVGMPSPAPVGQADVATSPLEVLVRWLDIALLAAACGGLLVLASIGGVGSRRPVASAAALQRRLVRLAALSTAGALLAHTALFALQVAGASGASAASVLQSTFGVAWLAQEVALVVVLAAAAAWAGRRGGPRHVRSLAVLALAGLLAGVEALTGHIGTGAAGESAWRWLALSIHLVSMLAWAGGLVALAAAVGPLLSGRGSDRDLARAVLRRFWRVAAPSVGALAITGLYLGGQLVASVDALLLTTYGRALLLKTLVALVAVGAGGLHALALHPRLRLRILRVVPMLGRVLPSSASMRRTLGIEACAALVVVLLAAVMASSSPAVGPQFLPAPAGAPVTSAAGPADDLMVTVSVRPDRPGPNFVDVGVLETRKPAPAPIGSVTVLLTAPSGATQSLTPAQTAPGRYLANDVALDEAGQWRVAVVVVRPGLADASFGVAWPVATPLSAPHTVLVSDRPLAPLATPAALALLVLAVLLAAGSVMARRWDAGRPGPASGSRGRGAVGAAADA